MIQYLTGNLLEHDAEALVNTVNTVGIMGKGVALQFRQAFPDNYEAYRQAVKQEQIAPGRVFVYKTGQLQNPKFIINFPTKRHWRGKARIEDIRQGLDDLVAVIKKLDIRSIALPPLGCGNGGLNWPDVKKLIENALGDLEHTDVFVFEPKGAPNVEAMRVSTKKPNFTPGRAALVALLDQYSASQYRLSMLEVQKLAYLLQTAGEPLKLGFEKALYGPYSEKLHHVLQLINGHFIRGYGDRTQNSLISVSSDAAKEARRFLDQYPDTLNRLKRVAELIEGFETPYGMELLATVHWISKSLPNPDTSVVASEVRQWSPRKERKFTPDHVQVALERLSELSWI